MKKVLKSACLAGAAWSALQAGAAVAQTAPPKSGAAESAGVEEVVVTARRQSEVAMDVPISVTAFSADHLDKVGAFDITELEKTTPNTIAQVSRGTNSTLTAYIRGIGQQDPLWGFEPGVGLYIDDVYIARPQLAVLDILDVTDIEVLRGPQGTLYGRNTIGGAIKYDTARIGATPELDVKEIFGSYNEHDEIVSIKAPINDKIRVGFAMAKDDHDGYGTDIATGAPQYNKDVLALRGTIEVQPTSDLFFRLSVDRTEDDSNAKSGHRLLPFTSFVTGTTYEPLSNPYSTDADTGDRNKVVTRGISLLGQWDLNPHWTLKSITAYRDGHTDGNIDFDETPESILDVRGHYSDHQFTEEVQALYNGDRLHGVFGVFYMNATASGAFDTDLNQTLAFFGQPLAILTDGAVVTKSWSVYANGSYDITSKLALELGGRWTSDDKTGTVFREAFNGAYSYYFGGSSTPSFLLGPPIETNYTNEKTFTKFTPKASLTYKITPELTTYASYSSGFKSGGFDMRGDAAAYPATVNGYRPETVDSFEVGLKGSLFDHRLNFSTAVFDGEYKDIQITTQYAGVGGQVASVVDNVGAGYVRGFEGESSFHFTHDLSMNVSIGYLDTKYTKWLGTVPAGTAACPGATVCTVDFSGARNFAMVSRWNGAISGNWTHSFGDKGTVSFIPVASMRSGYQIYETPNPLLDQKGYWLFDANLVWTSPDQKFEIGLHGKNLTNKLYTVGGYDFSTATVGTPLYGNSLDAFYGNPRTILATVAARF